MSRRSGPDRPEKVSLASVHRRQVLASTAALSLFGPARAAAVNETPITPPVARVDPVIDTLFGTAIVDPYRWMESEGAEWRAYADAEAAYAAAVLSALPGRDELASAIEQAARFDDVQSAQAAGDLLFMEIQPPNSPTSKIFVLDGSGRTRVLVDPAAAAPSETHASIDWWSASPTGEHLLCGLSLGGTENSTAVVIETRTGRTLTERIDRTEFARPSWAPDGMGFFYTRLRTAAPDPAGSACWFHPLGTEPRTDVLVLGPDLEGGARIGAVELPMVTAFPGSDLVIATLWAFARREVELYVADLGDARNGKANWRPLCALEDQISDATVRGSTIYLLSFRDAPRGKILKVDTSARNLEDASVVLPQGETVIAGISVARNGLYVQDSRIGVAAVRRIADSGQIEPIALPFEGALRSVSASPNRDGVWLVLNGWLRPATLYRIGAEGDAVRVRVGAEPPIDLTAYVFERGFAPAADGVEIPLSIYYRRGLKRDGRAPLNLFIYGAYGEVEEPHFNPASFPFMDLGGVCVTAHIRGGGELGEDWHKAGQKLRKFNTWRDAIAAAEHLIRLGYTSSPKLVVQGGSAGAIGVGRFITERPDLAAAAIIGVGVCNILRMPDSNAVEFGSVKDPQGFRALYAMDAYQHVVDGVRYPSVMLTAGANDTRVPPWQSGKMAARLRAASRSGNPILLRLEKDAGHLGSTRQTWIRGSAEGIAFKLWRTGDPRYQPRGRPVHSA